MVCLPTIIAYDSDEETKTKITLILNNILENILIYIYWLSKQLFLISQNNLKNELIANFIST